MSHGISLPYDPAIHGPLDSDPEKQDQEIKTFENLIEEAPAKSHDMPYYFSGYADKMSLEFAEANLVADLPPRNTTIRT